MLEARRKLIYDDDEESEGDADNSSDEFD